MAATVTVNARDVWGRMRVSTGEFTLSDVVDTIKTKLREVYYVKFTPGYKGGIFAWTDALASIPTSSGTINVASNSATYTTGTFLAIGY